MNMLISIVAAGFLIGESFMGWLLKPEQWMIHLTIMVVGLALLVFWGWFFKKANVNTMVSHKLELHRAGWAVFSRKS